MAIQGFRDIDLRREHGYLAQQHIGRPYVAAILPSKIDLEQPSEQRPDLVMLTPSEIKARRDRYHDVLRQLATAGVRKVAVDGGYLDLSPEEKLALAYMKPSKREVPGIEAIFIGGITPEDIWQGVNSVQEAKSMEGRPDFKASIEAAIAECLR